MPKPKIEEDEFQNTLSTEGRSLTHLIIAMVEDNPGIEGTLITEVISGSDVSEKEKAEIMKALNLTLERVDNVLEH